MVHLRTDRRSPPPAAPATRNLRPVENPNAAPVEVPNGVKPEVVAPPSEIIDPGGPPSEGIVPDAEGLHGALLASPPPPPPPPPPSHTKQPARVGGLITRPERTVYVPPAYPAIARSARIEGTVILEAPVGTDGAVTGVRVLPSVPLLDDAAIEAVKQWRFMPTRLNGEPVPVLMT